MGVRLFPVLVGVALLGFLVWKNGGVMRGVDLISRYPGVDPGVLERVDAIARTFGAEPVWLADLINFESSFSPKAKNRITGATGLIQFMPSRARELGTSTEKLESMTALQQLNYVRLYLHRVQTGTLPGTVKWGPLDTEQALYMAVFYPKAMGWEPDRRFPAIVTAANPAIRTPQDFIDRVRGFKGGQRGEV